MRALLSDISDIRVGFQSRKGIRAEPGGSHSLIQSRDFDRFHRLQWENLIRFNPGSISIRYQVRKGNVLFQAKGQENFAYIIDRDLSSTLAANSFYIIRVGQDKVLPAYLSWWLNQSPAQEYLMMMRQKGSSLQFIPISLLSRLEIPIPPLEIQKKIMRLETLHTKEENLTRALLNKKSALIEAVCLKTINKLEEHENAKFTY